MRVKHPRSSIYLGILFLSIFWSCDQNQPATSTPPPRDVWLANVDSEALHSEAGIRAAVDRCEVLIPSLRAPGIPVHSISKYRHGRNVSDKIDPKHIGRDPLKELIDYAHEKDIIVIAWFEFGFSETSSSHNGCNGEATS